MSAVRAPKWALSFADLCLLLLGFFVILHAQRGDPAKVAAGLRAAFGDKGAPAVQSDYRAAALFEPGEAVLTRRAAAQLARVGRDAVRAGAGVLIVSEGMDRGSARLDGWEMAAARAAAVARGVRSGGLAERAVTISIPAMGGASAPDQRLRITQVPALR